MTTENLMNDSVACALETVAPLLVADGYPQLVSSRDDDRHPSAAKQHLRNSIRNEFSFLEQWIHAFGDGMCPASGKPIPQCRGCKKGTPRLWSGDEDVEETLKHSPFTRGSSSRGGPHWHQRFEATVAVLHQIRTLWDIYANLSV